jgi:molybdopterin synthase sulfur carrier subunit
VTVRLFAGLRDLFGWKESQIPIGKAPDVARLLEALCPTEIQRRALLNDSGALVSGVIVLVNGHHCLLGEGVTALLNEGDEVAIFPPISGG